MPSGKCYEVKRYCRKVKPNSRSKSPPCTKDGGRGVYIGPFHRPKKVCAFIAKRKSKSMASALRSMKSARSKSPKSPAARRSKRTPQPTAKMIAYKKSKTKQ